MLCPGAIACQPDWLMEATDVGELKGADMAWGVNDVGIDDGSGAAGA